MTWPKTPDWACPRTMRWLAMCQDREARYYLRLGKEMERKGYEGSAELYRARAGHAECAARRYRNRATRLERRKGGEHG